MADIKQDLTAAEKAAQAAILNKVNQDTTWVVSHRAWLIAALACFVVGVILGHLLKL